MTAHCSGCRDGGHFTTAFSMAFQPIVSTASGAVFAHEALVRGPEGEGAAGVLATVNDGNRYAFDQKMRVRAVELAAELGIAGTPAMLSINFMPNAVYEPTACIRQTLRAAAAAGLPPDRLIFEFVEDEALDTDHIGRIVAAYRDIGFMTALDDFGAGFAGLGLLARMQPDIVKLDMSLLRGLDTDRTRRVILRNTLRMLDDLNIIPICEGVETAAERDVLRDLGADLMQGYFFARPAFESLVAPRRPSMAA